MAGPTVEAAITLKDILTLAATTGIFTACANEFFSFSRERRTQRRVSRENGIPFARTLVGILNDYAKVCAAEARSIDESVEEEYYPSPSPPPLKIPTDGAWAHIPSEIVGRISDLEVDTATPDPDLEDTQAMHGPMDASRVAKHRMCLRGHQAHQLSEQLRRHFNFGQYERATGLDFPQYLAAGSMSVRVSPLGKFWQSQPVRRVRRLLQQFRRYLGRSWEKLFGS